MAAGASTLNFALILSGILLRLTPERAPRTVLRDERPENLGFYACMVTANVGSFKFVLVTEGELDSKWPTNNNNTNINHLYEEYHEILLLFIYNDERGRQL